MGKLTVVMLSLLVLFSAPLAAEDAVKIEEIYRFTSLIRWSGLMIAIPAVFIAWLTLRFMRNLVDSLGRQFAQRRMALQKAFSFLQFVVYLLTGLMVFFLCFRVDDRVLALIGGTLAVSIGFAMKDLAASLIAGLTVMIDRPFQVGDRISFEGHYGDITAIGLRSVRMQTLTDDTITIPNNKFLSEVVVSGNYGAIDMQVNMPFYIGLDQDIETATDIVREAAAASRFVHLPKPIVVLVKQTMVENYIAVMITVKAYVLDTQYEKLFETDVNLRVMAEFRKQGIAPPAILHRNH